MTQRRPVKQPSLSDRLLRWFDRHGRKDLPWQDNPTPYRVWVSEIMLQQTQVATVIPYYLRFMQRFPDVATLAAAHLDEVMQLWSGLGYYARARNLHRAAAIVCEQHAGELPRAIAALQQLPGIGRTTAAAILALAHGERHAILDGNVRRVFARLHAVEGWPGRREIVQQLWSLTESHLPAQRLRDYSQALMDLGATLCTRARPACARCPLAEQCVAHAQGDIAAYPTPKPRKRLPVRSATLLLLRNDAGEVLLEQRPPAGIWGGLWSLPECEHSRPADIKRWCRKQFACQINQLERWPTLRHSFSHFHLDISPLLAQVNKISARVMEPRSTVWYNIQHPEARGLSAPVQQLLAKLKDS